MYEAFFINRSIQYHRDMKYHAMDEDSNYSAKSIERLIVMMLSDGTLFEDSDDDYSNSFSVTFLKNRIVVGVGILIEKTIFRILLNDGSVQDYDSSGNLVLELEATDER